MAGVGTGSPISFRCAACRSWRGRWRDSGGLAQVTLTGQIRARWEVVGRMATSPRNAAWSVSYRCQCGHVGWSSHVEIVDQCVREHRLMRPEVPPRSVGSRAWDVAALREALERST